jgi:histidinol-phosphate/aromatic aminotransferase/cobyric acid decarboxylase-like protein
LSKAWAAAGLRCGVVVANTAVIGLLQRVIAPYPLSSVAVDAALKAISGESINRQQQFVKTARQGKTDLYGFLSNCDWVREIWNGEANFILIRVADGDDLVSWCAGRGIRIRNFSSQAGLEGCVRLTIGSTQELVALKSALQAYGERA